MRFPAAVLTISVLAHLAQCEGIGEREAAKTTFSIPTATSANSVATVPTVNHGSEVIEYDTVTGYFLQDEPTTDPTTFDYTKENFGLINRTYSSDPTNASRLTQWQRFDRYLQSLNAAAGKHITYKLLFIGRHGEGYHNAAETFYGTPSWNCYDAEFRGNATVIWQDAELTPNGIAQAEIAHQFWKHEMEMQKIRPPMEFFTSPLTRCLQTAKYTYSKLDLPKRYPFVPLVKELFREGVSIHRCDRRRDKSYIERAFPGYRIESTFTDEDEIWNGITRESSSAQDYRSKIALDDIFFGDSADILSITTHSGEAGSLLRVLKHRAFSLNTGAIIPVLVRAKTKKVGDKRSYTTTQPWSTSAWCTNAPPVTSQSTGALACVCSNGVMPTTKVTRVRVPSSTSTSMATA